MKERLTGAIILVALIVLLVPELLTGPPRVMSAGTSSGRTGAVATSAGRTAVHSYTLPLGAGESARAATIPAATPVPARRDPAAKAPVARERTDRVRRSPAAGVANTPPSPAHHQAKVTSKPAHAATRPASRPPRPVRRPSAKPRWAVQLGVFAVHSDALRLGRRVRARGIPVHIATMHVRGRLLWRVRTGAVSGRAAGRALAHRLRALGLKGELLRQ